MKLLSLLMWVSQFGLSCIFPIVIFLWLGVWLRTKFGLGLWILLLLGLFGVMTSVSTARSCLRSLRKAAEEAASGQEPPVSFNNHD